MPRAHQSTVVPWPVWWFDISGNTDDWDEEGKTPDRLREGKIPDRLRDEGKIRDRVKELLAESREKR